MTNTYPASDRQVSYVSDLLAQREWPAYLRMTCEDVSQRILEGTLDGSTARILIDALRGSPRIATNNTASLSVGMYRTTDGTIYRVHESRESGRLYAKRLDYDLERNEKPRFTYDRGAIYRIAPKHRMSLEDARAWGVETGACCVCGAFLTDARSVARGIGPICEGKV